MENETQFADHLLSTQPRFFTEPQIDRNPSYRGPLERLDEEEVRVLMGEVIRYFNFRPMDMPLPPRGLPGFKDATEEGRQWALVQLGYRYFQAIARNESRTMNLIWKDAAELLAKEAHALREQADNDLAEINRNWTPSLPDPGPEKQVYFIASETGPIKIGIAANPPSRLSTLQTGHHEKLRLLVTCEGGEEREKEYHRRFAAHRRHGEWFERHPDILAEIERLNQE